MVRKLKPARRTETANIEKVWKVLNRDVALGGPLEHLRRSLSHTSRSHPEAEDEWSKNTRIAFAFDTNAAFRVGSNGSAGTNAVDYLNSLHNGPIIVPGQVIQELWNNILSGLEPRATKITKALQALESEVNLIGRELGPEGENAREALSQLLTHQKSWVDPASRTAFDSVLDVFVRRAHTAFVPRARFHELASIRHASKTPPGFKDSADNHGDFLVWSDFLLAALNCRSQGVDRYVLVTNEAKLDWSRNGTIHPILRAEAEALLLRPFDLWSIEKFHRYVKETTESGIDRP